MDYDQIVNDRVATTLGNLYLQLIQKDVAVTLLNSELEVLRKQITDGNSGAQTSSGEVQLEA